MPSISSHRVFAPPASRPRRRRWLRSVALLGLLVPSVSFGSGRAARALEPWAPELDVAAAIAGPSAPLRASPLRLTLPLPEPSFASRLSWDIAAAAPAPAPPRATLVGWVPTLLLAGAFAVTQFAIEPPHDSRWTDRNGFDSAIRRGLRGGKRSTRDDADLASDVLFGTLGASLVVDWWWLRGEYGLARSVQVDTRWILATNVTTRVAKVAAGRQRPYVQPCGVDPDYVSACGSGRDGNAGFFSGHASNTAALAGLLCARHLHRRESSVSDAVLCGGAVAGSLTTGILRIVSEKHFATDVLAGWVVGGFLGYYLPSHFDYRVRPEDPLHLSYVAPVVGPDYYGLQLEGRF